MTSRSSRLAPTFVLGDLVFLSSKVYICTCVTIFLVHCTLLIKLAWQCTSLNIIVDAAFLVCNCVMLSKASIDQNEVQLITYLMLQWALSLIAVVPIFNAWHILLDMTFLGEYYWSMHMFIYTYICFSHRIIFFKQSLFWLLISTSFNKCWVE